MAGDLNLTLYVGEIWGKNAQKDVLAPFFNSLFDRKGLIDLQPIHLEPTWRNKRAGEHALSKHLDIFLIAEDLIRDDLIYKSEVESGGLSDHRPITLSISIPEENPPVPFKFNPNWLDDEEYRKLVKENWKPIDLQPTEGYMQQMVNNLSKINKISKEWGKLRRSLD